jgi:hypothetical protein
MGGPLATKILNTQGYFGCVARCATNKRLSMLDRTGFYFNIIYSLTKYHFGKCKKCIAELKVKRYEQ